MKTTTAVPTAGLSENTRPEETASESEAIVALSGGLESQRRLGGLADQLGTFEHVISVEELLRAREEE